MSSKHHDYAAAFAKIEKAKMSASSLTKADCLDDEYETIRHALRFAEKMMQSPSDGMCEEAVLWDNISDKIEAAVQQALKELEEQMAVCSDSYK